MKVSALRLHLLLAPSLLFCTSSALASPQPGAAAGKSHTTSKQGEPDTGADVWNFERIGEGVGVDGRPDRAAFSKLAPWPDTDGHLFYSGCYDTSLRLLKGPTDDRCFMVEDVSDADHPRRLAQVGTFDPIASPAPPKGHIVWSATYAFPNLPVKVPCKVDWADPDIAAGRKSPGCWDPGWNTHTHYVSKGSNGLLAVNQERYMDGTDRQQNYRGVKFYDVSDPKNPRYLSYWEAPTSAPDPATGKYPDMSGTHHFNFDGKYLYLGTEYKGYLGKILVILDVSDPMHPREVSHWAIPGQRTPQDDATRDWVQQPMFNSPVRRLPDGHLTRHVGMHYATPYGDVVYLAYHQAGLVILDVHDKAHPKLLSRIDYNAPGVEKDSPDASFCRAAAGVTEAACGNAHSAKLVPGRPGLLVMTDEYFTCPFGHMRLFDVRNPRRPKLLSHMLLPETTRCDPTHPQASVDHYMQRGPSTHIGNALNPNIYMVAWYGAGLRAIDISDARHPHEVGRYIYKLTDDYDLPPKYAGRETYDVIFGKNGRIYVADGTAGIRVVRYTGPDRER